MLIINSIKHFPTWAGPSARTVRLYKSATADLYLSRVFPSRYIIMTSSRAHHNDNYDNIRYVQ